MQERYSIRLFSHYLSPDGRIPTETDTRPNILRTAAAAASAPAAAAPAAAALALSLSLLPMRLPPRAAAAALVSDSSLLKRYTIGCHVTVERIRHVHLVLIVPPTSAWGKFPVMSHAPSLFAVRAIFFHALVQSHLHNKYENVYTIY